ncbi:MAG: bifunctional aminoglycoside phosphotransferase/ATP-binding protein [Planctomycetota bacterium]|jgi:aminoglycoside phosphotransferase family enzyme
MDTAQLINALSRPEAYRFAVDRVEVRQTHISVLFLAGNRVYKVKRPVDLGYLDYTSLPQRRHFCQEEVRLNRRLAGDVYLGVVAVVRSPDGNIRFAAPEEAADVSQIIDYAVEMRRLPQERMLSSLLERGEIDTPLLDDIADVLLRFHQAAATGPGVDEHGTPEGVVHAVLGNLHWIESFAAGADATLSAALFRYLRGSAASFLDHNRALLERRVRAGHIRDGHGDLHAGNICLTEGGIVIYDCIEFDPRLRCGDAVKDLAFLIMDLDARDHRASGRALARRYARVTADEELDTLLPFYKAHFACVRGKVNSIAAADRALEPARRAEARSAARRYFHLAASYWLPPALIVMCGLPGSGKSWVARDLARPFAAAILASDVIRKRLAGIAATAHPTGREAEALYSARSSARTYTTLLDEAGAALAGGHTVVADATFPHARARAAFVDLARAAGAPCVVVHLDCPEEEIARRLRDRPRAPDEVSDADWEVYRRFKPHFEPPNEIPQRHLVVGDGTEDTTGIISDVIDRIIEQTPGT